MHFGGLYVDVSRTAVFVFPTSWDDEGTDVAWHLHGAYPLHHPLYGSDWTARASRSTEDTVALHLDDGAVRHGRLVKDVVEWDDGVGAWTRVHVTGAQLAVFRRPPVPFFFTAVALQVVSYVVHTMRATCRRVAVRVVAA
jgi:hypothetical protein